MAKSYYSVALDHSAGDVWAVIRPFDHYAWAGIESETIIEEGKAPDQVGAIRRVSSGGKVIRQVLLAHSDIDRSYTYALCHPSPFPIRNYTEEYDRWVRFFEDEGFAKWLSALRRFMKVGESRYLAQSRDHATFAT